MVNQQYRNCIKQARTYPGADIGSDHNSCSNESGYTFEEPKEATVQRTACSIRSSFNVEVKNTYEILHIEENCKNEEDNNAC